MSYFRTIHTFDVLDEDGTLACSAAIDEDGAVALSHFGGGATSMLFSTPEEARKVGQALIQAADHAPQKSE